MIDGKRVLALIPARAGSKGLPGKNIRPLGGKPLLAWPIEAARASRYVDEIVLSTDSAEFAEIGKAHGARVPALRPAELAVDTSPSIDFILHMLDLLEAEAERFDYLVLLEPTSPLTDAADVDAALERLIAASGHADALAAMTAVHNVHPDYLLRRQENGLLRPFVAERFGALPRRQELESVYALDGSLYMSTVAAIRRERGFYHDRTIGFEMPRHKAFEIDDLVDFICVEAIWRNLRELNDAPADSNH
jgi:CMP-N,N'-diacetyllegionaminic acid synthase